MNRYERMTHEELVAELRRRDGIGRRERSRAQREAERLIHELEDREEELAAKEAELLELREGLQVYRHRYADLYDFAPLPYVELDPQGTIREINLAGASLLAQSRLFLRGTPFLPNVYPDDRPKFLEHMRRCRSEPGPVQSELRLRARGRIMPVELYSRRTHPVEGSFSFRTVIVDLTDRINTEQERRRLAIREQAARIESEAKDRFLATLSHELRTPLAPILASVSLLWDSPALPDELRHVVEVIRRNVELEGRLVDDLLDLSRIRRGKLELRREKVDVHQLLRELAEDSVAALEHRAVVLDLHLEAREHHVAGDPARLSQIFWNLVRNAAEHSESGGRVELHSANAELGQLEVHVRDTGSGIDPEDLERIFEPFEQGAELSESHPGLGLGLAIAKNLVEAHGGSISAYSEGLGKGAVFRVELPVVAAPRRREAPPEERRVQRPLKLLLVEDHRDTADALAALLRSNGHEVRVASSVAEALAQAEPDFDVLVSDLRLSDGDGRDLVRKLSAGRPLPAIAVSGYGSQEDVRLSREAGFAEHLTKPLHIQALLEAIDRVVGERAPATASHSR